MAVGAALHAAVAQLDHAAFGRLAPPAPIRLGRARPDLPRSLRPPRAFMRQPTGMFGGWVSGDKQERDPHQVRGTLPDRGLLQCTSDRGGGPLGPQSLDFCDQAHLDHLSVSVLP
jgi:hypothetical protein